MAPFEFLKIKYEHKNAKDRNLIVRTAYFDKDNAVNQNGIVAVPTTRID